ncbi:arsenate reductase family protein [Paenirhodobacter populi]|uniref:arsenate reductase family protein n=1 Tax=Paenirhodobacter populi TaxID=2306993 RepID=UPI000FE39975|nr:ArsC/Spx/MgsR family protein [Sinirhodobacter populi]RWR08389.1 hypothetical protein D2T32_09740 [Sinirhodobacter populi]
MILYGIPTCDTCRKAKKALEAAGQDVTFRDVRAEPLTADEIGTFLAAFGDRLVNRASTTWRGLSEMERAETPEALLAAHPALMKRPILQSGDRLTLGWDAKTQAEWL